MLSCVTPGVEPLARITRRAVLAVAAVVMVSACQGTGSDQGARSQPGGFPASAYELAAEDGLTVYDLEPGESTLRAFVYRAGPMARQGHNHVIVATDWRGALALDADKPARSRLDLRIPVAGLAVDPPELRRGLGGSFGSDLSASAREGTRANMLGPDLLAAAEYDQIAVSLVSVTGELPRPILTLAVTIRGRTSEVEVPVAVTRDDDRIRAQGRVVLRHDAFGLKPISAAAGALRVAEAVTVEFQLVGSRRED